MPEELGVPGFAFKRLLSSVKEKKIMIWHRQAWVPTVAFCFLVQEIPNRVDVGQVDCWLGAVEGVRHNHTMRIGLVLLKIVKEELERGFSRRRLRVHIFEGPGNRDVISNYSLVGVELHVPP